MRKKNDEKGEEDGRVKKRRTVARAGDADLIRRRHGMAVV
jgi:hypothetical protein